MNKTKAIIKALTSFDITGIFAFEAETEVKTLKKSRLTSQPTPDVLLNVKKLLAATVSLGNDYETAVNNRRIKEGSEANFEAKESYCEPVGDNNIVFKHKDKEQFYLRVYPNLCKSFHTSVSFVSANGQTWTEQEFYKQFSEYLPAPSKSGSTQGLNDPIQVRNYKLENIRKLKRGSFLLVA